MNGNNFGNQKEQDAQRHKASAGTYRPITLADVQGSAAEKNEGLSGLMSQLAGSKMIWLSAPLVVLVSVFAQGTQILTPLVLICLLGVLLYRMDDISRKLAAVPLCFGAFRLLMNVATLLTSDVNPLQRGLGGSATSWETCLGMPWVPALFVASLLYAPIKDAVTTKIIYWESMAMFISGLIPGLGFVGVLCVIHYTLFIAIIVGLVIDLQHRSLWGSAQEAPAVKVVLP